jgi:hypothetical protein
LLTRLDGWSDLMGGDAYVDPPSGLGHTHGPSISQSPVYLLAYLLLPFQPHLSDQLKSPDRLRKEAAVVAIAQLLEAGDADDEQAASNTVRPWPVITSSIHWSDWMGGML